MEKQKIKKRDTKLEAQAAEFLVLSHLLLERISAFKTYTNFPGYDLIATGDKIARIQVKSRYQTNYDGFPIKNFASDFVVFVALNRGIEPVPKNKGVTGIGPPEFFVFPINYIEQVRDQNQKNKWGKIMKKWLDLEKYKDKWSLIKDFIK